MAKKQTFQDKLKQKEAAREFLKVVKAYKSKDGSWKFNTRMVELNDDNKNEVYK